MQLDVKDILGRPHTAGYITAYGETIYSISHGRVRCYDVRKRCAYCLDYEATGDLTMIAISPCGNYIIVADSQNRSHLLRNGQPVPRASLGQRVERAALSANGVVAVSY